MIEGSWDGFWGAGAPLDSTNLKNGNWTGQNHLGRLLTELKDDLIRERAVQQLGRKGQHAAQTISGIPPIDRAIAQANIVLAGTAQVGRTPAVNTQNRFEPLPVESSLTENSPPHSTRL